jgi:hypothetical protein
MLNQNLVAALISLGLPLSAQAMDGNMLGGGEVKVKSRDFPIAVFEKLTDPGSPFMSADGMQLAESMGLRKKLERLSVLNALHGALSEGERLTSEQREERSDLRFAVLESVEETRLQIDYIVAEIDEEQAILNEAVRLYSTDRDNRVNRANLLAFRTNGVLWAVAEALDIPTYKTPQLSIPSGAVGIVAGIVPSIFSIYATHSSNGSRYSRKPYPNILSKFYDFPTIPRIEYPPTVWDYFNAKPHGAAHTRREMIQKNWLEDNNIHIFKGGTSDEKLKKLTGNEPYVADMNLIEDKLIMMDQIKAVTLQMSRPLLEICMVARGKKRFVADAQP